MGSEHLQRWLRAALAGPITLAAVCLTVVGGALWLPAGTAQVNNLVIPVVLFPLLWAILFLYAILDHRLARAYAVVGGVVAANLLLLSIQWMS